MKVRSFTILAAITLFTAFVIVARQSPPSASTIINEVRDGCVAGVAIDIPANVASCADEASWPDLETYGPYIKTE